MQIVSCCSHLFRFFICMFLLQMIIFSVTHIVKRNIHVLKIVEDDRLVVGVLLGMEHFTWHYKT